MVVRRGELLGCTLLLWTAAALLTLYLLCNPAAAGLEVRLGSTRLWGVVLGLAALGLILPGRGALGWPLALAVLPMVLLPPPLARRAWPAALGGSFVLAAPALLRRRPPPPQERARGRNGTGSWRRHRRRPARPLRAGRNARFRAGRRLRGEPDRAGE